MPASSFDPDASYGIVSPHEWGAAYWQNGKHYDVNYNEVEWGTGKVLATYVKPAVAIKAKAKSTKPRASDKPFTGMSFDPPPEAKPEADAIDLNAWADGKATGKEGAPKYPWFKVAAAIEAEYGVYPENQIQALAIITGDA